MVTVRKYALPLGLLADTVLIIVFAAIGRGTHEESNALAGALDTAWPFLVGLACGWLICMFGADATRPFPGGVIIWIATVAVGMALRHLTGDGTALAFVLVATFFNLATLVGWRLLAGIAVRSRA